MKRIVNSRWCHLCIGHAWVGLIAIALMFPKLTLEGLVFTILQWAFVIPKIKLCLWAYFSIWYKIGNIANIRRKLCTGRLRSMFGPDFKAISPLNEAITWICETFRIERLVKGIKRLNTYTLRNHGDEAVLNASFHRLNTNVWRHETWDLKKNWSALFVFLTEWTADPEFYQTFGRGGAWPERWEHQSSIWPFLSLKTVGRLTDTTENIIFSLSWIRVRGLKCFIGEMPLDSLFGRYLMDKLCF